MENEWEKRLGLAMQKGLDLVQPGTGQLVVLNVKHDSYCGIYHDKLCNCDPEITATDADTGEQHEIFADGSYQTVKLS